MDAKVIYYLCTYEVNIAYLVSRMYISKKFVGLFPVLNKNWNQYGITSNTHIFTTTFFILTLDISEKSCSHAKAGLSRRTSWDHTWKRRFFFKSRSFGIRFKRSFFPHLKKNHVLLELVLKRNYDSDWPADVGPLT